MASIHKIALGKTRAPGKVDAFSLIEVVVAVGIFAIGIVAVIGLLSPTIKSVTNVTDSTTANRLADNIQLELQRIGFTNLTVPLGGPGTATTPVTLPLTLVATRDGSQVLLASGSNPPANHPTMAATTPGNPPGILNRDRYYGITVSRLTTDTSSPLYYNVGSGFLALSVKVVWPYQIPSGPDTGITTPSTAEKYIVAPTSQQSVMLLNMAINP